MTLKLRSIFLIIAYCAITIRAVCVPSAWAVLGVTTVVTGVISWMLLCGLQRLRTTNGAVMFCMGTASALTHCSRPQAAIEPFAEGLFYFMHPSQKPVSTMAVNAMHENFIQICSLIASIGIGFSVGVLMFVILQHFDTLRLPTGNGGVQDSVD